MLNSRKSLLWEGGPPVVPVAPSSLWLSRSEWLRLSLVPLFVGAVYLFLWTWLKVINCAALLALLQWSGIETHAVLPSSGTLSEFGSNLFSRS